MRTLHYWQKILEFTDAPKLNDENLTIFSVSPRTAPNGRLVLGGGLCLVAAISLLVTGPAVVRLLESFSGATDSRSSGDPIRLIPVAWLSAVLLAIGFVVSSSALCFRSQSRASTYRGRMLLHLAGVATLLGGATGLVGAKVNLSVFNAVANTEIVSQEALAGGVSFAARFVFGGYVLISIGAILTLLAGCFGCEEAPTSRSGKGAKLAFATTSFFSLILALSFALIRTRAWALSVLDTSHGFDPLQAASLFAQIAYLTIAAFICIVVVGVAQIVSPLVAPQAKQEGDT